MGPGSGRSHHRAALARQSGLPPADYAWLLYATRTVPPHTTMMHIRYAHNKDAETPQHSGTPDQRN
jgi:hypothetical protein